MSCNSTAYYATHAAADSRRKVAQLFAMLGTHGVQCAMRLSKCVTQCANSVQVHCDGRCLGAAPTLISSQFASPLNSVASTPTALANSRASDRLQPGGSANTRQHNTQRVWWRGGGVKPRHAMNMDGISSIWQGRNTALSLSEISPTSQQQYCRHLRQCLIHCHPQPLLEQHVGLPCTCSWWSMLSTAAS
jgi:hypothetical protein